MTIDPPAGTTIHPYDEFAKDWTGATISFLPDRSRRDEMLARYSASVGRATWLKSFAVVTSTILAAGIFVHGLCGVGEMAKRSNSLGFEVVDV